MHSSVLLSLAVGLLGLDLAVAGPCRPSTTDSTSDASVPSTTSTASETSTSSDIVSIDSTTLSTSTFSETSLSTSAETSTTSSAAPSIPTSFNIVASSGPAANKVLRGRAFANNYVLFDSSLGGDVPVSFEASSGRLHAFDSLYLCALYNNHAPNTASFIACSVGSEARPFVTCEPPTGSKLECSIPGCHYDEEVVTGQPGTDDEGTTYTVYTRVCDASDARWSTFYSRVYTGASSLQWHADLGPPGATGDSTLTPIDFLVNAV